MNVGSHKKQALVMVVDDNPENLMVLGELLEVHHKVRVCNSGEAAMASALISPLPDLILLDVMMPGVDGYEVLRQLKSEPRTTDIPVIFVTAKDAFEDEERGLKLGATDYINKPVNATILLARVQTHLELKHARDQLARQNAHLESEIQRRVRDIVLVQDVSIRALASLGETRDNETGNHIQRTQHYVSLLGKHLQNHPRFVNALHPEALDRIVKAAPLHDIGKIGIRDEILLKPGKLTLEEFEVMKTHAEIGGQTIEKAIQEARKDAFHWPSSQPLVNEYSGNPNSTPLEFLEVAREIAAGHHEKWDGSGYPLGLKGDDIPASARLMALADVFDALISRRVYKEAFPLEHVLQIIRNGRGNHFDPAVVDAFEACLDEFLAIAQRFSDETESVL
ncbi:MAG: hypothetical protein RL323_2355 [Pseudomonadota bacterium]|jgi:putative two-component system response regulator